MLLILESVNYGGKTTTIECMRKKRKKWSYAYHPRWNDSQEYEFLYNKDGEESSLRIPRDIMYQVSHGTILKYLESFHKTTNIVLDRTFFSEMVYSKTCHQPTYQGFCDILKSHFDYRIFYLYVSKDEELVRRIEKRYNDDIKKKFGCVKTDSSEAQHKDDIIKERFNLQRELHGRYLNLWLTFPEDRVTMIDTASIKQGEVARIILNSTK